MADNSTSENVTSPNVANASPSSNNTTHQMIQFDWRLTTTVGCSTASVIPLRGNPNGMPLLQLTMDTAARSTIDSDPSTESIENYFNKFPSAPELNVGLKPADGTSMWELNATELDEVIARLQGALALADKACPLPTA